MLEEDQKQDMKIDTVQGVRAIQDFHQINNTGHENNLIRVKAANYPSQITKTKNKIAKIMQSSKVGQTVKYEEGGDNPPEQPPFNDYEDQQN